MNPWLIELSAAAAFSGAVVSYAAVDPHAQLFGATVRYTAAPQKLAITFDDGPNPAITPRLLDLLDRYDAKATFFLVGRFVQECPALTTEISARGHVLGNHTQAHPNLLWLSPREVRSQLQRCHDALREATGASATYFRPPFGLRNPWVVSTARELGMQTVMWTLLPGDWQDKPLERLTARMQPVATNARDAAQRQSGDILCLHDGGHRQLNSDRTRTLAALEYWFPLWRDAGLEFVTIGEAANNPAN